MAKNTGKEIDGGNIKMGLSFDPEVSGIQRAKAELNKLKDETYISLHLEDKNFGKDVSELKNQLREAQNAAAQLSNMLDAAFNKDLGKLNISSFEKQLMQSKTSLQQIYNSMAAIGPMGERTFRTVAAEVLTTNTQMQRTETILDKMATTMGNTLKWGVSSSIMKNFTTSVQQAYRYVQNLDYSLNQIRIVSNESAESMDKFAVKANNSAKALGAATRAYTDASLIYFQQGLGMEEATARTDVTIKMSNALGESASKVSDYMTAIWNNFDDGSKSLEYFGDVLAKLGASTASSAEEIAEGLDKFASVGNTVGLSYEYATTALATVVAETRQSADVVGTAFKTLFARIQDLELGKTLDDDTTLGTYSQALQAVGIQIKDQQGSLKDMDDILDEMGSKWKTLGKDQQVALAQQVAGTRQYTQLVALMDNWDTFNKNLKSAEASSGTLEQQQAVYMESIDAHIQKLKTSWEELYASLGDTDTIKTVLDGLTGAVDLLDNFVDSIGGSKGAFLLLGATATKVLNKQIARGLGGVIQNFKNSKKAAKELDAQFQVLQQFDRVDDHTAVYRELLDNVKERIKYQDILNDKQLEEVNNAIRVRAESRDTLEKTEEDIKKAQEFKIKTGYFDDVKGTIDNVAISDVKKKRIAMLDDEMRVSGGTNFREAFLSSADEELPSMLTDEGLAKIKKNLSDFYAAFNNVDNRFAEAKLFTGEDFAAFTEQVNGARSAIEKLFDSEGKLPETLQDTDDLRTAWTNVRNAVEEASNNQEKAREEIIAGTTAMYSAARAKQEGTIEKEKTKQDLAQATIFTNMDAAKTQQLIQDLSNATSGVMSLGMAIQSVQNLGSIWDNEDLSFWDKLLQIIMSVSMALNGTISSIKSLNAAKKGFQEFARSDVLKSMKVSYKENGEEKTATGKEIFSSTRTQDFGAVASDYSKKSTDIIKKLEEDNKTIKSNTEGLVKEIQDKRDKLRQVKLDWGSQSNRAGVRRAELKKQSAKKEYAIAAQDIATKADERNAQAAVVDELTSDYEALGRRTRKGSAVQRRKDIHKKYGGKSSQSYSDTQEVILNKIEKEQLELEKKQKILDKSQEDLEKKAKTFNEQKANFESLKAAEQKNQLEHDEKKNKIEQEIAEKQDTINKNNKNIIDTEKEINEVTQKSLISKDKEISQYVLENAMEEENLGIVGQVIAIQKAENLTDEEKLKLQRAAINNTWEEVEAELALKAARQGTVSQSQAMRSKISDTDYAARAKEIKETAKLKITDKAKETWALIKSLPGWLKIAAAAIAAVGVAFSIANKDYKDYITNLQSTAQETQKQVEKTQEQIDANRENAKSYRDLYEQLENGSITQSEFNASKLDLISSMGDEINVLDNLIKKYGDYDVALQEYNKTQNEAEKKNAEKGLKASEDLAYAQTQQGDKLSITKFFKTGWNRFMSGASDWVEESFSDMDKDLFDRMQKDIDRVSAGMVAKNKYSAKELEQMGAVNRQKLGIDDQTYSTVHESALEADTATLKDLMGQEGMNLIETQSQEDADAAYETYINEVNKRIKEGSFNTADAQTLLDTAEQIAKESGNDYATQAAYKVSQAELDKKNIIQSSGTGSKSVGWKINWSAQKEEYSEWFDAIYDMVQDNPTYKMLMDEGLIDWNSLLEMKDLQSIKEHLSDQVSDSFEDLQESYGRDHGLKLIKSISAIAEKSMSGELKFSDIDNGGDLYNNYDTIIKEKDEITSLFPELSKNFEIISNKALAGTKEFSNAIVSLQNASQEITFSALNKQLKDATAKLNSCKKGTQDWDDASEDVKTINEKIAQVVEASAEGNKQNFANIANGLGNIKDNYSAITEVAKDYNSDGKITIDNLETILTMDDEYLACLRMQNGQLTINKKGVQDLIQARLDNAKATAYEALQTELTNIANGTAAKQTYKTAAAAGVLTEAMKNGAEAAMEGGAAFVDWTENMAKGANVAMDNEQVKAAFDIYQTKIKLIGTYESEMKDNLDAALKDGTDSQADMIEYLVDKYEKINRIIEKLSRNLQNLQDQQDKLVGADLLSNLNQQTEVLNEQNKAYEKKLELQKEEAASLRQELAGYGATFDQDNNINYNAFMVGITNAANAGSISEDQYNRYKEAADNYKELWESSIHDVEDSITETANKLAEIELQKLNVKVNMQLDVSDATRQYNEWYNNVVKHATRAFGSITNVLTGELAKKNVETYMDDTIAWIEKFKSSESLYKKLAEGDTSIDQSAVLDDLKTSTQGLMEAMNNIESEYKNVSDAYLSSIDDWAEALDNINSDYESINSQLNHAVSLTKLLFGDSSYSTQNQYLSKSINTSMKQLQFAQQQVAKFQKKMNEALAKGDDELYEKYKEKYSTWLSNMNNTLDSTLQNIQTKYTNSLNQIFADFEKNILSTSLDKANEEWDRLKTSAGLYLDKVNQAYEITKLQTKYIKQINSTSNVEIQNKINKAMETQIKALKNKTKLSKYDVDLANARYETLIAEIALQEAQANKTKMQLQRDSQGNYSYVYSQDEETVADARDKADAARINEWNIIKEKNDSIVSDFSTQMKNFETALQKAYTDNMSDPKAREEEIKKIISEFKPIFGGLGDQWSTARDDMAEWIASDKGISVKSVTDDMIKGYYPNWNNNMVDMLTKMGNSNDFEKIANDIAKEADTKTTEYQTQTSQVLAAAKTSLSEIKDGLYGTSEDTQLGKILKKDSEIATAAQNNVNKLEELKNKVSEVYNSFMERYGTIAKGYLKNSENWLKSINATTQKYQKSLDGNVASIKNSMKDITTAINNSKVAEEDIRKAVSSAIGEYVDDSTEGSERNTKTKPAGMPTKDWETLQKAGNTGIISSGATVSSSSEENKFFNNSDSSKSLSWGVGQEESVQSTKTGQMEKKVLAKAKGYYQNSDGEMYEFYTDRKGNYYYSSKLNGITSNIIGPTKSDYILWRLKHAKSYDTGGYTGDWSSSTGQYKDGKFALLHKKELILNEDDTKNILAAVDGIRSMSSIIEMLDAFTRSKYSATFSNISQPSMNRVQNTTDNSSVVTQNIEINADFSGLHDAQELENAIDNLSNRALQYAYKNI